MDITTLYYAPLLATALVAGIFLFNWFLRSPHWGLALIVFALPFERIGSIEIGGITLRVSYLFIVILGAAVVCRILLRRDPIRGGWYLFWILGFIASALASLLGSMNLVRGLQILGFTLITMVGAWLVVQTLNCPEKIRVVVRALFWSAIIVSLFGLYQFVGDFVGLPATLTGLREHYTSRVFGFARVQSTALEPLYFANYLLIPLAMVLALALSGKDKLKTFLAPKYGGLLMVAGALALILTLSRGGYLGALAAILVLIAFYYKKIFRGKIILMVLLLGVVLGITAYSMLSLTGTDATDRFWQQATNFGSGASVEERYSAYDLALHYWELSPWTGIGYGNFGPRTELDAYHEPMDGWPIVNNEPLELLAEIGIVGFLWWVVLLGAVLWVAGRAIGKATALYRPLLVGLLAAFIGIIVQYCTFSTLYLLQFWMVVGLLIALGRLKYGNE